MKGVLEVYVLLELSKKDSYGYELVTNISKYEVISESTLYPILRRLEEAGELSTYNMLHNGRNRKYYKINQKGIDHINEFLLILKEIKGTISSIRGDNNEENIN